MILDRCPGAITLKTPTLTLKSCPQCGEEIEIFSNDTSVTCSNCGFIVFNETLTCIQWCKYAKECVGEDMYKQLYKLNNDPETKGGEQ